MRYRIERARAATALRRARRSSTPKRAVAWLISFALAGTARASDSESTALGRAVDLSHAFAADTIYWPTEEGFVFERGTEGVTPGGYFYAAHRMRLAEHGGTHVDAPIHFHAGGSTLERIPLARLIAPAVVVDVRKACAADRDHAITRAEIERFEARHGRIADGSALLFDTGFALRWPDRERYLGTALRGAAGVAQLHFPGLDPAAARWLVAERALAAVGLDTASIDPGTSKAFESHRILFAAEIPAFENLAALDQLPPTGATLIALPMKIAGGSGGPLRAVAILPRADAARLSGVAAANR
jgi:kynurenine formamidase